MRSEEYRAQRPYCEALRSGALVYPTDLAVYELERFGQSHTETVVRIMGEGAPDLISGDLALAGASRETNITNVAGGGYFADPDDRTSFVVTNEDRGLWQFNEVARLDWLLDHRGCESGRYDRKLPNAFGSTGAAVVPGLSDGARFWLQIIASNVAFAGRRGVPMTMDGSRLLVDTPDALYVGLSGYNRGIVNAINAYFAGLDPDSKTTNGNYARDTLIRRSAMRRARRRLGWD